MLFKATPSTYSGIEPTKQVDSTHKVGLLSDVGKIIVKRITRFIEANKDDGVTNGSFAKSIGASNASFSRLINSDGEVNIELKTLIKIAGALGIKPWELLRDPGGEPETSQVLLVVSALAARKGFELTPIKREPNKSKSLKNRG